MGQSGQPRKVCTQNTLFDGETAGSAGQLSGGPPGAGGRYECQQEQEQASPLIF